MPAISPFLINLAPDTGIRLADVGLKGNEYFMLVNSVTDSAEFQEEILLKNTSGKRIYHALLDPVLTYSFETKVLAFHGLANAAPGTDVKSGEEAITPTLLNNVLTNNFQFAEDGDTRFLLRRPRRIRRAGDLADYSFDIVVTNAVVNYGLGATQHTSGSAASVLTMAAEALPSYDLITGFSMIARRSLDITGPISGVVHYTNFTYWRTWPAGSATPANYAAYQADFDTIPNSSGREIVEIFVCDTPGGRNLSVPSGVTDIGGLIAAAIVPGVHPYGVPWSSIFAVPGWTHIMETTAPGGGSGASAFVNASGITTAAAFVAGGYVPSGRVLLSLWCLATLSWLTVP